MTEPEEEQPSRVRVVRDSSGRVVGFQDPDFGNRFITRDEAIQRLKYNLDKERILDSFGNTVEVGALKYPAERTPVAFINGTWFYKGIGDDPSTARPKANQEIVEQVVALDRKGNLVTFEISYGEGKKYREGKYGGKWRYEMSKIRGVKPDERLPSNDLEKYVIRRDWFIRTTER